MSESGHLKTRKIPGISVAHKEHWFANCGSSSCCHSRETLSVAFGSHKPDRQNYGSLWSFLIWKRFGWEGVGHD